MDKNVYKEFIKAIELKDVFLSKITSKRSILETNNSDINVDVEFKPDFNKLEQKENEFTSVAQFHVTAKNENEVLFEIECEFTVINYIDNKELMQSECIDTYVQNNLPIITWPYGREIINSMTTRMGFPALILGNHKVV
ncbi:protein-export chaperone SecB [Candidatus Clostridium helianthi]|jgi:preprotein translocase subunit SecB|uniref:Protein-export chaperone SecB n=1 Tax=Candidatus Clostridium helianthi TaxID=3381660 RepID=A0ABW8S1B1_9CLOT